MNGLVTNQRFKSIGSLPIALPQTTLGAGNSIVVGTYTIKGGQKIELHSLTLNVIRVITIGVVPVLAFSAYDQVSAGFYRGSSNCSPLAYASVEGNNAASTNAFRSVIIEAPGTYQVIVQNNTTNIDFSVVASGALKLYS